MDPTQLIIKVVAQNEYSVRPDAVIGQIGHVSRHLGGSLLSATELTVL